MINNEYIKVTYCLFTNKALKAKSYYVKLKWYLNGKAKQKVVSTGIPLKGNNKRKAQSAAEQIRDEFEKQINMVEQKKGDVLLSDFIIKDWLSAKKISVRQSTYEGYSNAVYAGIKPYFDKIGATLKTLTATQIQNFYNDLIKRGMTSNTVKHYHSYLSNALKYAIRCGLITHNPIDAVVVPKVERQEMKAMTEEQLQHILSAFDNDPLRTVVYLGAYGGMRRSEILGLQWSDIDLDSKIMYIHRTRTAMKNEIFEEKTKSETSKRYIPIAPELKTVLLEERTKQEANRNLLQNEYDDNDFVCRYADGRPLKCHYVSSHFKLILRKLGYNDFHFHSLRHTTASIMANSGVGIKTVSSFLGHSNLSTTNIYVHTDNKAKQEAVMVLSDLIKGKNKP